MTRVRPLLGVCALLLGSCTSAPYYIGAACHGAACGGGGAGNGAGGAAGAGGGSAGNDAGLSFAVDLDESGASRLQGELELPASPAQTSLRFRGESATADDWRSDQGELLQRGAATPATQLEAPFTDGTRAVGFSSATATYVAQSAATGAVDEDDFALELVLRAVPGASIVDKRGAGSGWAVKLLPTGELTLELRDERRSWVISSEPLLTRAWYHCSFWVSRAGGGRADCNGRPGELTDLSGLGSLTSSSLLAIGGGAPTSTQTSELAHFSVIRVAAGALGQPASWSLLGRQRFAELTGVSARVAGGSALPRAGLRESPAYLDLQRGVGAPRRLFLVGPDWPRITCRSDAAGARECGYLSEPERPRRLAPEASGWQPSELALSENAATFVDGEPRMTGLVPSTARAPHTLSLPGSFGGTRQALSFFARAEQTSLVSAAASGHDPAIFDLASGTVVSAPSDVQANIEAWGDGVFRCAYAFSPVPGLSSYELSPLATAQEAAFVGDGSSASVDIAGLQLDVGQAYAGSLLAAPIQAGERLGFIGNDGNLPRQSSIYERVRVLLPAGPRLTDQALLNLNRGGQFDNQVQLYITGDTSELKSWGLREGATHWAFPHPLSVSDGLRHAIEASWGPSFAELSVDGTSRREPVMISNDPPFELDRIDVGFSNESSGNLEGLVAGIEIGAL